MTTDNTIAEDKDFTETHYFDLLSVNSLFMQPYPLKITLSKPINVAFL